MADSTEISNQNINRVYSNHHIVLRPVSGEFLSLPLLNFYLRGIKLPSRAVGGRE
jgi:hypothetical protein